MESKKEGKALLKPGTVFVSKRTSNFKYVDKDGTECWVVPMSRYYANETILRGQPVAICQAKDLRGEDNRFDPYPYVKVYDPDVDEFCIGVATNYVTKDEIVNIQNRGKFDYLTLNSKKAKAELASGNGYREVYIDTSKETWMYESMRGQTIYVSAKKADGFPNAHDSTPSNAIDSNTTLTYDFIDSVYTTKNTIQLGHLTDAPVNMNPEEGESLADQVVTIELDVTGDTRGPLDNTQFILTLGEDISFKYAETNKDLTNSANGNENIFDEVKVVAINHKNKEKPALYTLIRELNREFTPNPANFPFVAIRNLKGKVVVIPFAGMTEQDFNMYDLTDPNDIGYRTLVRSYCNEVVIWPEPAENLGDLPNKIKAAFESFEEIGTGKCTLESRPDDSGVYYVGEEEVGWFDIYESSNLKPYLNVAAKCHGSSAEPGLAVLADIRDFDRVNAIGVVLSNQEGLHPYNNPDVPNTIKVLRQGRFVTKGTLVPGAEYYLSVEGRITTKNQAWYDTSVKIGTAENEHTLLVDIQEVQHDYNGATPLGYIRPCIDGNVPEKGFILADGVTPYSRDQYGELYEYLRSFYTDEELQLSDENTFIIPKILMDTGIGAEQIAQIKFLSNGLYNNIPRIPTMRFSGEIKDKKVPDFDITKLVHYGTLEQSRIAPTLENIDIRLFYWDPESETLPNEDRTDFADRYVWREIPVGLHVYDVDTVYGFEWVVLQDDEEDQDGLYRLHMNIGNGLGVCKIASHRGPISLEGKKFKLLVNGKNLWTREYSLYDESNISSTLDVNTDTLPPSVNAVKDYIARGVDTEELNAERANVENLKVKDIEVEGKEIVYHEDLDDHLTKDASEDEVHGLLNKGFEGNINAKKLAGLMLGVNGQNITPDTEFNTRDYIPYIQVDTAQNETKADDATLKELRDGSGTLIRTKKEKIRTNSEGEAFIEESSLKEVDFVEKSLSFGNTHLIEKITPNTEKVDVELSEEGNKDINVKGINNLTVKELTVNNEDDTLSMTLDYTKLFDMSDASTIALKEKFGEKINPDLVELIGNDFNLKPTEPYDETGKVIALNEEGKVEMPPLEVEIVDEETGEGTGEYTPSFEFGEALQALYELPIASFDYKTKEYKRQLGILVERVNQARDLFDGESSKDNSTYSHKILGNDNIIKEYNFTKKELKSISGYLDLITNKDELGQQVRATVGLLLKAAQETQSRLLNIESSVFGKDSPTFPGNKEERDGIINNRIATELQEDLNNLPLFFGLNRLMRVICLELFDTTDLEEITSEKSSNLIDTDDSTKVSIKSRLDLVDQELSKIVTICNGLVRIYKANFKTNLSLFEPVVDGEDKAIVSEEKKIETPSSIEETEFKDVQNSTWKSLPSAEEYENAEEPVYAVKLPTTETHKPSQEDTKVLLDPVTKTLKLSEYVTSSEGELPNVDVEIIDYDPETHLPMVTEKKVANLGAKVERMNQKLSHLTKTIHGTDEVLSDPNTITTLQRNVQNLIDDLYPNEHLVNVSTGELFNPFRRSSKTGRNLDSINITEVGDESANETHYSVLRYYAKELYNYDLPFHYIERAGNIEKNEEFTSILTANTDHQPNVSANELKPLDSELGKAYSFVRVLSKAIGLEDIYPNEIFKIDNVLEYYISNTFTVISGPDIVGGCKSCILQSNFANAYKDELSYKAYEGRGDGTVRVIDKIESFAGEKTYTEAALSRKSKSLASRVSSIESTLDALTNSYENPYSKEGIPLKRFEERDLYKQNTDLVKVANQALNTYLPPLENIIEGSKGFENIGTKLDVSVDSILLNNLKILTKLKNEFTVMRKYPFSFNYMNDTWSDVSDPNTVTQNPWYDAEGKDFIVKVIRNGATLYESGVVTEDTIEYNLALEEANNKVNELGGTVVIDRAPQAPETIHTKYVEFIRARCIDGFDYDIVNKIRYDGNKKVHEFQNDLMCMVYACKRKPEDPTEPFTYVPVLYINESHLTDDGEEISFNTRFGHLKDICLMMYRPAEFDESIYPENDYDIYYSEDAKKGQDIFDMFLTGRFDKLGGWDSTSSIKSFYQTDILRNLLVYINERISKDEPDLGDVFTTTNDMGIPTNLSDVVVATLGLGIKPAPEFNRNVYIDEPVISTNIYEYESGEQSIGSQPDASMGRVVETKPNKYFEYLPRFIEINTNGDFIESHSGANYAKKIKYFRHTSIVDILDCFLWDIADWSKFCTGVGKTEAELSSLSDKDYLTEVKKCFVSKQVSTVNGVQDSIIVRPEYRKDPNAIGYVTGDKILKWHSGTDGIGDRPIILIKPPLISVNNTPLSVGNDFSTEDEKSVKSLFERSADTTDFCYAGDGTAFVQKIVDVLNAKANVHLEIITHTANGQAPVTPLVKGSDYNFTRNGFEVRISIGNTNNVPTGAKNKYIKIGVLDTTNKVFDRKISTNLASDTTYGFSN